MSIFDDLESQVEDGISRPLEYEHNDRTGYTREEITLINGVVSSFSVTFGIPHFPLDAEVVDLPEEDEFEPFDRLQLERALVAVIRHVDEDTWDSKMDDPTWGMYWFDEVVQKFLTVYKDES